MRKHKPAREKRSSMISKSSFFFSQPEKGNPLEELSGVGSWTYSLATHEFRLSRRSSDLLGLKPGQATISARTAYRLLSRQSRKDLARLLRTKVPDKTEFSFFLSETLAPFQSGHYLEAKWDQKEVADNGQKLVVGILQETVEKPELQIAKHALRERIKEQDCIYTIATLGSKHQTIPSYLQAAVEVLPQGWQFPGICGARIQFHNHSFQTSGFVDSEWIQVTNKVLEDGKNLSIAVTYSEDPGTNPPFLEEENRLLESITNLIGAEIDRKSAHDFNALLLDSSPDVICTLDREGNFLDSNFTAFRMWGYAPYELTGRSLTGFLHPGDLQRTTLFRLAIMNGQKFSDFENQIVHRNGSLVPCIWSAYWSQENQMMHCVVRDGTDRRKARREQESSEQRLNALLRDGSDLIGILDQEGNYTYVAPTSTTNLGVPPEAFLGKSAFRYIHPEDRPKVEQQFHSLQPDQRLSLSPFRYTQKDGSIRWFQTVLVNMRSNPAVGGIVANARDVTERMESEEELRRSNERSDLLNLTTGNCIWDWDRITNELYLGAGFGLHLQLEPSNPSENRKLFLARIHPDDRDAYIQSLTDAIQSGAHTWNREYRFAVDRGYIYVQDQAILLQGKDETVDRILGSVRSIHDQYLTKALDNFERQMMEHSLMENASLSSVLARYLLNLETLFPGIALSLTRLDQDSMPNLAAPSVPQTVLERYTASNEFGRSKAETGDREADASTGSLQSTSLPSRYKGEFSAGTNSDTGSENALDQHSGPDLIPCWSILVPGARSTTVAALTGYQWEPGSLSDREPYLLRASRLLSVIISKFDFIAALKSSNNRYQSVSKAVGEGLFEIDLDTNQMELTGDWTSLSGHSIHESHMATDWEAVVLPQDRTALQTHRAGLANSSLESGETTRSELDYRILRKDRGVAFVRETALLIRDLEGRPERIVGSIRNIDRIKVEELTANLLNNIARVFAADSGFKDSLQSLLEILTDFGSFSVGEMWIFRPELQQNELITAVHRDDNGRQFQRQSVSTRRFGAAQGLPGNTVANHATIVWEDLGNTDSFIRKEQCKAAGLKTGIGIPLRVRDLYAALVFLGKETDFIDRHFLKTLQGTSDYIAQEVARKLQEEKMNFLFEGAPDILAIAGPDGRFVRVNPAFCALMELDSHQLTSRPFQEFMHPEDRESTLSEYRENVSGRKRARGFINRYRTASGDYRWLSWSSSEVFGYEDQVFAYGRDITDRILYTKKIELQNSKLRQIAWIQSHMVRAPLARIMGLVELLELEDFQQQDRPEFLKALKSSALELDQIIREIVEKAQKVEESNIERHDH